jgi:integrase
VAYPVGEHKPWPEHVLNAALESDDQLFRLAVATHYYTGQRTGDCCNMSWNIITADWHIPVVQQKTRTSLEIPVHPKLRAEIEAAPRPALSILSNQKGGRLRPDAFRQWCKDFGETFGIELVPHGLRKNAVNGLLEAGCSTAEVSSITGQSLAKVESYAKHRNQPKIAKVAMGRWAGVKG